MKEAERERKAETIILRLVSGGNGIEFIEETDNYFLLLYFDSCLHEQLGCWVPACWLAVHKHAMLTRRKDIVSFPWIMIRFRDQCKQKDVQASQNPKTPEMKVFVQTQNFLFSCM